MWKFVADGYEVSTDGQVRSFKSGAPRLLKPQLNTNGYLYVVLCVGGTKKPTYIHRLVAEAFIPNPDNKSCVNHLNGVKTDNHVSNLEWCTYAENNRHALANGLSAQGGDDSQAYLTNADARYIRENPDGLTCQVLADKFGVDHQTISLIQLGKTYKTAGGAVRKPKRPRVPDSVRAEIRRLYVRGERGFNSYALAEKFDVSPATVWRIVSVDV